MRKPIVLIVSSVLMAIGGCGGPMLIRLYFLYGGESLWLSAFLQNCGFPITLISLIISYFCRHKAEGSETMLVFMKFPMLISTIFLGVLIGLGTFTYAIGQECLPVSTLTIVYSTQLVFTAIFAFFIIKQKFTIFSGASVVFLVVGVAFLAVDAVSTKTAGENSPRYVLGIIITLLSAVLFGLFSPLTELLYIKSNTTEISYTSVMEMQLMISFFATILSAIAMLVTNSFKTIGHEAKTFQLGETNYYLVIISTAILFQFCSLGSVGVIFSSSALFSGIITAILLPIAEVLAVICLHEKFSIGKGISLGLCLLGFALYYHGEIRQSKISNLSEEDVLHSLLHDTVS